MAIFFPFLGSFEMPEEFSYISFGLIFSFALGGNLFDFMRLTKEEHRDFSLPYPQSPLRCSKYGCWEHGVLAECLGLISALSHIHHRIDGKVIIHRDIKPSNILIDNGKFKLADFGASRIKSSATSSKTEWWKGTEAYSPPELFLPNAYGSSYQYGRARDVWALDCVFFEVLVMLASLQYDHVPSVQEFQDARRKASEDRGDKYSTDMFAKNMECVEALANRISHLNDPL
jgi:serine/threonine protein kinase